MFAGLENLYNFAAVKIKHIAKDNMVSSSYMTRISLQVVNVVVETSRA